MRNHIINKLEEIAKSDERIMLLVGDLGFNVVEKFADTFPNRFINCGIAEENMLSVAAGLAIEGNIVFVYSIGNFPTIRCMEQIRNDICYHNANVKIISVGGGFSYGSLGMTHHSTEDLAAMRIFPGMRVYAPADPVEAIGTLKDAYESKSPCYIRLARGQDKVLHLDKNIVDVTKLMSYKKYDYNSSDVSVITAGTILNEGILAEKLLKNEGLKVRLYSAPLIKPFDAAGLREIASTSKLLVTVEEHNIIGGLGGTVAEVLSEMTSHASLIRFGLRDEFSSKVGSREYIRTYYGMDGKTIVEKVVKKLGGQ